MELNQMNMLLNKRTKRNLIIFIVSFLGLAWLAGVIEPLTIPPDAEPGTSGLGQLLWLIAPLAIMVLLRTFGGDGWDDFGLRPNFKGNSFLYTGNDHPQIGYYWEGDIPNPEGSWRFSAHASDALFQEAVDADGNFDINLASGVENFSNRSCSLPVNVKL